MSETTIVPVDSDVIVSSGPSCDAGDVSADAVARLKEYDELFSYRYSDQDDGYMATLNSVTPGPPPCVENWYTRPKRSFDWTQQRSGGGGHSQNDGWRGRGRGFRNHSQYDRQPYHNNEQRQNYDQEQRQFGAEGGRHRGRDDRVHYAGIKDDRRQN